MSTHDSAESDIKRAESDKNEAGPAGGNDKAPDPKPEAESDAPLPPMTIAGRGLIGQDVPDVTTGSTPLTRRDD